MNYRQKYFPWYEPEPMQKVEVPKDRSGMVGFVMGAVALGGLLGGAFAMGRESKERER